MRFLFAAALCAAIAAASIPVLAATTGLVRGTVLVDTAPKAGVQLTLAGEGTVSHATTNASGEYVFAQVPFGQYELTAHYAGFADRTIGLSVASGSVQRIDFTLGLKIIANANVTARAGAGGHRYHRTRLVASNLRRSRATIASIVSCRPSPASSAFPTTNLCRTAFMA